jgi:hypothetical protein
MINHACSAAMKYRLAGKTPPCPSTHGEGAAKGIDDEGSEEGAIM